jgi:hypothetical protein
MVFSTNFLSIERRLYIARCNLIREERHLRLVLAGEEEQERRDVCDECVALYQTLWRHEAEERYRQSCADREYYAAQLHRNPNSPIPTAGTAEETPAEELQSHFVQLACTSPTASPSSRETADLLLWEDENRQDLQLWEWDERRDMAVVMARIAAQQRSSELRARERICTTVLNGTTVLEWSSYPSYDD